MAEMDHDAKRARSGLPSRRAFLSEAAAMGVAATVGGMLPARWAEATPPTAERHLGARWQIEAVRVEQTFGDGTTVPFFRFIPQEGTPANGPLPLLRSTEGRLRGMVITNGLDFPIQPEVVGVDQGPVIEPGQTRSLWLIMPPAGTYLLTDALLGPVGGPVGLGAMLISEPMLASSAHDREYVLLYQDADDRWNLDVDAGLAPDASVYEPNYHTVNGLTFPETTTDPDTYIACNVGENVLLRIGNLGHVHQSIHFHGYHVDVLARDNVPETMLGRKDTIGVPGYTTAEFLLHVNQPGVFPLHPHSLTTVTDNGLYPCGQILLIDAAQII